MKQFLSFLLILASLWSVPVIAKEEKPFIAVYMCENNYKDWNDFNPDFVFTAFDWTSLPLFLRIVRSEAGDRPILIDFEVHGDDDGLQIQYDRFVLIKGKLVRDIEASNATMGYVVNKINEAFPKRNKLTVLLEACWAGRAYKYTIRQFEHQYHDKYFCIESCPTVPDFPIYGASAVSANWNNSVFMQWFYDHRIFFEDLRKYETEDLPPKEDADGGVVCQSILALVKFFWIFGPLN